jgi:hypothetical protein
MEKKKQLPVLSPQQQSEINQFYTWMAVAMARHTENNVVLARNQYVEATIWELLNKVPDKLLLLGAWVAWFQNRDRAGTLGVIPWHVTQFHREIDGSLAAVDEQIEYFRKHTVAFPSDYPLSIAHRLLGGAA